MDGSEIQTDLTLKPGLSAARFLYAMHVFYL